jgi:hypothetical protein
MALGFDELAVRAQRVVVGTVSSVEPRWAERDGNRIIETVIDLTVETELSNASAGPTVRIVQPGGQIGDVGMVVSGLPEFRAGEHVLVFLRVTGVDEQGVTEHAVVGMAQGKFAVLPRLGGGFDVVQQVPSGLGFASADATGAIRAEDQHGALVLDLDEALARIRRDRGEDVP